MRIIITEKVIISFHYAPFAYPFIIGYFIGRHFAQKFSQLFQFKFNWSLRFSAPSFHRHQQIRQHRRQRTVRHRALWNAEIQRATAQIPWNHSRWQWCDARNDHIWNTRIDAMAYGWHESTKQCRRMFADFGPVQCRCYAIECLDNRWQRKHTTNHWIRRCNISGHIANAVVFAAALNTANRSFDWSDRKAFTSQIVCQFEFRKCHPELWWHHIHVKTVEQLLLELER